MGVRRARIGLLAAVLTGWMLIVVGLIGDFRLIVIVGASLLGIATTLVTKLVVELRTELAKAAGVDALDVVEARVALIERSAQRTRNDVSQVAAQSGLLSDEVVRLSGDAARAAAGVEQLLADARRLEADARRLETDARTTRAGLGSLRTIVDKIAVRLPTAAGSKRLAALSRTNVVDPLLSIAIPSFNRPEALGECLQSLEAELERLPSGVVEICITDDFSTDPDTLEIAADFAERCSYASVRRHASECRTRTEHPRGVRSMPRRVRADHGQRRQVRSRRDGNRPR